MPHQQMWVFYKMQSATLMVNLYWQLQEEKPRLKNYFYLYYYKKQLNNLIRFADTFVG